MMNILHFSQSVKWSSWFICSLLLHGLIFLAFIWRFSEVQPAMSPAPAIMLQWAEIIEAPSSPLSLPVGIAQQESAVTEEKQQTEDRQQRPVTEDSDATIEITRKKKSSDGEKKKTRPPRNKPATATPQPFPVMLHLRLWSNRPVLLRLLTVTQQSEIILRHLGKAE